VVFVCTLRVLTNFKIQPISVDFRGIEALFLGVHSKTIFIICFGLRIQATFVVYQ
jgi:hypothetical protein